MSYDFFVITRYLLIFLAVLPLRQDAIAEEANDFSYKRFNFRFNPLLIAVGGNIDLDVYITPQFTVGPSFFGWGSCGPRQTGKDAPDGTHCNTWTNIGVRSNYYLESGNPSYLFFVGPGVYRTKKQMSYRFNQQTLSGDFSATSITTLIGVLYKSRGTFNVSAGFGGLYFLDKPSHLAVSNGDGTQTTISSGSSTQFMVEISLGFSF